MISGTARVEEGVKGNLSGLFGGKDFRDGCGVWGDL